MSDSREVMVVVGGGAKPGGFCFRNMGPDKVTVHPGESFPSEWVNPDTLVKFIEEGHMVYVGESKEEPKPKKTRKSSGKKEEDTPSEGEGVEKYCIFAKEDLDGMSRSDLDAVVIDLCKQAGEKAPNLNTIDDVKAFLTSGVK